MYMDVLCKWMCYVSGRAGAGRRRRSRGCIQNENPHTEEWWEVLNKFFEVDAEVTRLKINPQSYDRSGTLESAPEIELVYAGN